MLLQKLVSNQAIYNEALDLTKQIKYEIHNEKFEFQSETHETGLGRMPSNAHRTNFGVCAKKKNSAF